MQCFLVIGTAHVADPRLLHALEAALDEAAPDQLILEMPDEVAVGDIPEGQKPEMVHAWRWARANGVPTRGHEPAGPPILRDNLSPDRIGDLLEDMDRLVRDLSPRRTIDIFCRRGELQTDAERQLSQVVDALIDPDKAARRTLAVLEAVQKLSRPAGRIMIICGGAHVERLAAALPCCQIVSGEHFF